MGQGMATGKPFGESAAKVVSKVFSTESANVKASCSWGQEVATFAAGCFWSVTYPELLTVLWDRHDPTQKDRQGNDRGTQYRSAIFYHSPEQKSQAEAAIKQEQKRRSMPIVTQLVPATTFYEAETYHQQYLEKGGQCARKGDLTPIRCYG
ncbi:peptide methionine sulfoxide reductase [Nannochloropsis gaditana CCMP526]|uniref:peptide methionine sulfoxide reductase n=1 Tax=Nannochloropsis gaditana (strain CCMP526) TaxID=1093141 RepID=UPI00029F8063|nr:peptide methionine sulfoxide reductase [Nannochloropsis gaditana CCMP526]EKU22694.1 peptide methionine sulfoxide reductase [Nannochloropsis gaditana CCMP526]|eukprot:XP_005853670.1 peptide methionine sulfoxide reductase [Nannochloropsis gaditana CCMP526]